MSQQAHENEPTRDLDPQDERSARQNPHQHLAPESDMRRRQCSPRAAHQDHTHHVGAKILFVEVKFMLGASFEWLCAFFCEIIGISC